MTPLPGLHRPPLVPLSSWAVLCFLKRFVPNVNGFCGLTVRYLEGTSAVGALGTRWLTEARQQCSSPGAALLLPACTLAVMLNDATMHPVAP